MTQRTARVLAALADGTLPSGRHAAILRRVGRSTALARALDQQLFAVALIRSLSNPAPAALRTWVEQTLHEAMQRCVAR